jgi:alpha-D-ribose 1-methylphosphonate 5-triphosphate synthase subunit PhnG
LSSCIGEAVQVSSTDQAERRDWMGLLARAPAAELARLWGAAGLAPGFDWLRPPETGTVMVRGRVGGTGAPFNLGEMTVTRAALRLSCGTVGHAWVQGRDRRKAEIAALIDALMQTAAAERLRAAVLAPLAKAEAARRAARARKAAATQVEFFTMVRGEG